MVEQAPKIDLSAGNGRLVYDKSRRTIVAEPMEVNMPIPLSTGRIAQLRLHSHDLSKDDAEKICRVVMALATPVDQ